MQFRVWMFITILVYFYSVSVGSCSQYVIKYSFIEYINYNDHLYNGMACEAWYLTGNSCDPQFDLQIFGKKDCKITSKTTPVFPETRKINIIHGSTVSTSCNLSKISLQVTVKDDDDGYSSSDDIALFHKDLYPNQLSHYNSSGFMDNVYSNGVKLSYTIGVSCSSHYYGDKCDKYCKRTDHYNCSQNGNKLCRNGYYGPQCETVCRSYPKYTCNRLGKRICNKYYYGALCDKYCKRTDHYNCSKNGNKLCRSGYYGPHCDTVCRPSPKYTCNRLGKRICHKYYYGAVCDKYCKPTINYRCDKNGDKICELHCRPHGKCKSIVKTHFQCVCNTGWKGKLCNIRIERTTSVSSKILYMGKQKENVLPLLSNVQPTSMIIIVLLVIVCFCMITLVVIKKKANNIRQSTPVVMYQPKNSASNDSSKNDYAYPYSTICSKKYCIVSINQSEYGNKKTNDSKYTIVHDMSDNEPIYELPRLDHNTDDTCTIQTCISEDPYLIPVNEK